MIGDELNRLKVKAEIEDNISELRRWLRDNKPDDSWTVNQRRTRDDKEQSLKMWLNNLRRAGWL